MGSAGRVPGPFLPVHSYVHAAHLRYFRYALEPFHAVLSARRPVLSTLFTLLGYFFGNIPAVQDHFELVIVLILLVSLAPTIIGLLKAKFGKKKPAKVTDAQLDVMEDGIKNLDK